MKECEGDGSQRKSEAVEEEHKATDEEQTCRLQDGYLPWGHAEVPGSSEESGQSQKSSFTLDWGMCN